MRQTSCPPFFSLAVPHTSLPSPTLLRLQNVHIDRKKARKLSISRFLRVNLFPGPNVIFRPVSMDDQFIMKNANRKTAEKRAEMSATW